MPISSIIKENRKLLGLTQEQMAEALGVSAPAVNKWEKGSSYPDISLLAPLARLLKIDLNTLLCFQMELTEQEIQAFSVELAEKSRADGLDAGFLMAEQKIQAYPGCSLLMYTAATVLEGVMVLSGIPPYEKEKYEPQMIRWYEHIARCDQEEIRNYAVVMLAYRYLHSADYDKAKDMLDLLPERSILDKQSFQADLYMKQNQPLKALELMEKRLILSLNELQGILWRLTDIEINNGNLDRASRIAAITKEAVFLFGLWDYNAYVAPLQLSIAKKDKAESIALLKSLFSAVLIPWNFQDSPLYHNIGTQGSNSLPNLLPSLLTDLEHNPVYDFLRSDEEFKDLLKQCHKYPKVL